jgi:hypothetical protein
MTIKEIRKYIKLKLKDINLYNILVVIGNPSPYVNIMLIKSNNSLGSE